MTREEKAEMLERERDGWQNDADDHKKRGCVAHYRYEQAMADVLTEALTAFRGPQPDPETGLVPCGCGTTPTRGGVYGTYSVICLNPKCMTAVGVFDTQEDADNAWNLAIGGVQNEND